MMPKLAMILWHWRLHQQHDATSVTNVNNDAEILMPEMIQCHLQWHCGTDNETMLQEMMLWYW